jgi:tetratricopeptide (TPR) repeat protein
LATHLLKEGLFKDAIDELDRAREINPNDDRLYQSFGLIMIAQHNYRMAFAVLSEAARLNPKNPVNPYMNGVAHLEYAAAIDPSQSESAGKDYHKALDDAERFSAPRGRFERAQTWRRAPAAGAHLRAAWTPRKGSRGARGIP